MYKWKLQDTDEIEKSLMKKYIHAHGLKESILFSILPKEIYKFSIIPIRISMAFFT